MSVTRLWEGRAMATEEALRQARTVIEDPTLSFHQRRHRLAAIAENLLPYPDVSEACAAALDKRIICDLYEGNAPYRPRYVLPDYERAMRQGLAHLELPPPEDLADALAIAACAQRRYQIESMAR